MKNFKYYVSAFLGIVLLVFLDQYTKFLAVAKLKNKAPFELIPGVLQFEYVTNEGAAWSMLKGKQLFFTIITIIIVAALIYTYIKMPKTKYYRLLRITMTVLVAGALGNFIDRQIYGYVHDFIYFSLIDFPIFNVADCYVTVSAALLFIELLFIYKKDDDFDFLKKKKEKTN